MKTLYVFDPHFRSGEMFPIITSAWNDVYQIGEQEGVSAVVMCGDLVENAQLCLGRDHTAGDVISAITAPILRTGIRTIMLPGNHDLAGVGHKSALSALAGFPGIEVYERPAMVRLKQGGEQALVFVYPWAWRSHLKALPEFREMGSAQFDMAADKVRLAILHGCAAEWQGVRAHKTLAIHAEIDGSQATRYREIPKGEIFHFSVHDLLESEADAIAAGHVHMRQDVGGIPVYGGALVQQNLGEVGNPTGVMILDTETGERRFIAVDCRRHYISDLAGFRQLIDSGEFRPGLDRAEVRDEALPFGTVLPDGADFVKVTERKQASVRAAGATRESTAEELLAIWYAQQSRPVSLEALNARLQEALAKSPLPPADDSLGGCIDAIREIRIKNFATHEDTHLVVPEVMDGLIKLQGQNKSGKTTTIESVIACLWGSWAFYDVKGSTIYDMMLRKGDGLLETVLESRGHTYRVRRETRLVSDKTKSQECIIFEVVDGRDVAIAGGKSRQEEFAAKVEELFGTRKTFLSTVFQAQKDIGSFIDAEPSERMAFMRRLVRADRFGDVHEWSKGHTKELLDTADRLSRSAEDSSVPEDAVASVQEKLEEARAGQAGARADIASATEEQAQVQEEVARLRADQLAREEISRQVTAAEGAVTKAQSAVAVARSRIREDETELQLEPDLRESVARLEALRQERAEAQRQAERVAAEQARRDQVAAEVRDLDNQIAAAVQGSQAAVQAQRNEKAAEIRGLEGQIAAAVREATAAAASRRAEIKTQGETLKAQISAAVDRAGYGVREVRGTVSAQAQRARELVSAEKHALEMEQRRLTQRRGQLEAKARLLDTAGCKPSLLACPFIDDARQAPEELAQLVSRLEVVALAIDFDDYAHEARAEVKECEEALASLVDPDPATIAPELRQQKEALLAEWRAVVDPDPATLALDLRAREQALRADVASLAAPPAETIAVDLRQQVATLRERHAAMAVPVAPGRLVATIESDIRVAGNPEQELGRLAAVREHLEQRRGELTRLEADLAAAQATLDSERARLAGVASVDEALSLCAQQAASIDAQIRTHNARVLELERTIGSLGEQLRALEERAARSVTLAAQAEASRAEHAIWTCMTEFFSPAGVPQLLIDIACPQINDIVADLLARMGDSSTIEFATQKTLKGGGSREGVYILITDENSTRDIAFHSGGEQAWQRQIVRQAVGAYSVQRCSASHKVFVVDEPTAHVDLEHVSGLLGIIYGLADRFRQVWIIDHNPLDAVFHGFHFEKISGRSRVHSTLDAAGDATGATSSPSPTNVQETTHLVAA